MPPASPADGRTTVTQEATRTGVRVGVAVCDPGGLIATPLVTLERDQQGGSDLRRLADIVAEYEVVEVVVGLPRTLTGRHGPAAEAAVAYAGSLAGALDVPVRLVDERMTTVVATRVLAQRGVRGRKQRAVIDQAAATAILQGWLDTRSARAQRGGVGQ
jgi:putative Holliday junction resolvase